MRLSALVIFVAIGLALYAAAALSLGAADLKQVRRLVGR